MELNTLGDQSLQRDQNLLRVVSILGLILLSTFVIIFVLSPPFEYGALDKNGLEISEPTLIITGLLISSSVVAFLALVNAINISTSSPRSQRSLLLLIISIALGTRLIALFTCPILELDYYRYMWDGRVAIEGVSPYRYTPEQILQAPLRATGPLRDLKALATRTESNHTILARIHHESLTTIYPPVSQFVFSVAMSVMPETASVKAHITFMKFVLLLFDVGTLLLVLELCRVLNRHVGWLIVYAWNPLVIKEIANGGHLDSIATLFTVLSVFIFVQWYRSKNQHRSLAAASAVMLGLGVGAKLFSVVVFPILFVVMFRKDKITAYLFSLLFVGSVGLALWPMSSSFTNRSTVQADEVGFAREPEEQRLPESNLNRGGTGKDDAENTEGLTAFLSGWRMNDVVFSSVYLNLKDAKRDSKPPWFVVTSKEFRGDFCVWCEEHGIGGKNPSFTAARVFTLGLFSAFYLYQLVLIVKVDGKDDRWLVQLLQRIGLILVVFLFLQPTVNPWYLLWAIPFCSFSNNRGWLLVSGILLAYYSRFWFKSLPYIYDIGGADYTGEGLFDHFIAWGEHLIMVTIILTFLISRRWLRA